MTFKDAPVRADREFFVVENKESTRIHEVDEVNNKCAVFLLFSIECIKI